VKPNALPDLLVQLGSEDLVSMAQEGDRCAFEELYRRYRPQVVRRLTHLVGPSDDGVVFDLVQDTFIQAYRNLKRFRGESPFGHWVVRIATNLARSHFRRCRRSVWKLWERPETEVAVASVERGVDETYPTLLAVHQALNRLSPSLREAVILFELEGLSLAEMSNELQIPLHTAASRLRRGRHKLRKTLERLGFAPCAVQGTVALCVGEPR
jgi:RNA polymerase sigma-70 factor (ECF subfamily)